MSRLGDLSNSDQVVRASAPQRPIKIRPLELKVYQQWQLRVEMSFRYDKLVVNVRLAN